MLNPNPVETDSQSSIIPSDDLPSIFSKQVPGHELQNQHSFDSGISVISVSNLTVQAVRFYWLPYKWLISYPSPFIRKRGH